MYRSILPFFGLLLAPGAFAQVANTAGTCPGVVNVMFGGLTPGGSFAVVTGNPGGAAIVPGGPCAGTQLAIGAPTVRGVLAAGPQGTFAVSPNLPAAICSQSVQALDLTTCAVTNAAPLSPCGGYVDPILGGCWYTGALAESCTQTCATHGGFDQAATTHTGNAIGMALWPGKINGSDWESVECSSTDNNTNWGANGAAASPTFTHAYCHLNCSCLD